jgi:hypothetical protein
MFSHASKNEMTESLPAVRRHYDQVGAQPFRGLKNFDRRIAHQDFDLPLAPRIVVFLKET